MRNVLRFFSALLVTMPLLAGCAADAQEPSEEDVALTSEDASALKAQEPLPNFKEVSPGLYRGGHPNTAGIAELKRRGVRTIVDLEVADLIEATPGVISQELRDAKAAGITVVRFPMSAFEPALSSRFDTQMSAAMAELRRASPTNAVYVHCKHGQDRTGLVVGLHRVENEKVDAKVAYAEMTKLGFHTFFLGLREYYERRTGVDVD